MSTSSVIRMDSALNSSGERGEGAQGGSNGVRLLIEGPCVELTALEDDLVDRLFLMDTLSVIATWVVPAVADPGAGTSIACGMGFEVVLVAAEISIVGAEYRRNCTSANSTSSMLES